MKFWDTSALVPLVLEEQTSREMRLMISDPNCVVSFITLVELQSAVARRLRSDSLETRHRAAQFLSILESGWTVADDYARIIVEARRFAAVHSLRSADSIQLASATSLVPVGQRTSFVTLDEDLAAAARAEGFPVLP